MSPMTVAERPTAAPPHNAARLDRPTSATAPTFVECHPVLTYYVLAFAVDAADGGGSAPVAGPRDQAEGDRRCQRFFVPRVGRADRAHSIRPQPGGPRWREPSSPQRGRSR